MALRKNAHNFAVGFKPIMFNLINIIMSIYYSFTVRPVNPSLTDGDKQIYAIAQSKESVTLEEIAEHISEHNSVFSTGTTLGLLTDTVKCITENLKMGRRVKLSTLGTFYITLSGGGAEKAEDFSTSLIKHVNLRWKTSKKMDAALQDVTFERVPTIELVDAARKTMNQQANENVGTTGNTDGGDNSGGNGGGASGTGDPSDVTP